jgi:hypothetical protein
MLFILSLLLGISLSVNVIFIWYTRKLIQNLVFGVSNVNELQILLNEYATLLEELAKMENYYNDPIIVSNITNTKMVIEACRVFKNSIIENTDDQEQKYKEENAKKEESSKSKASFQAF